MTVLSKDANPERSDDQVFTVLEVDFIAKDIPEMGYKRFLLKIGDPGEVYKPGVILCGKAMENSFIKVIFNKNGTFNLINKRTAYKPKGLNYFVDTEETDCLSKAADYRTPFIVEADVLHDGDLPTEKSFVSMECEGAENQFVSCLKLAEDENGIIRRMRN